MSSFFGGGGVLLNWGSIFGLVLGYSFPYLERIFTIGGGGGGGGGGVLDIPLNAILSEPFIILDHMYQSYAEKMCIYC